ncbi:hypothetical protein [Nocardioides daeguensis]|uniref:Integral membrane protein n=1 Tax=Nocardioides daeguensis TaxID=908359 RepID=A0ABP6W9K2_9ACTN|nr:hypothetical protein [Nocardioides daeguensis]MBV6729779.1 hypothetical protein [Nocardioides daeguensis]MCR1773565.1 hypothetical protein [Nocardioides daeguensis]
MTSPPDLPPRRRNGRWRALAASLLVVLGVVLVPVSLVARYVDQEVGDTDRYVETVGPLADNPVVQAAIARRVTDELLELLRLDELTDQASTALTERGLPPRLVDLLRTASVPLREAITSYVRETVGKVVRSEQFADAWVVANRSAHEQLVALVTGEDSEELHVEEGTVSVNLAAVIATVKEVLLDQGFERAARIPEVSAQFVVLQSADLVKVQRLARALDRTATLLPVLALLSLAAAVALARRRRRVVLVAALAVAFAMVAMGVALAAARAAYLDAIPVREEGLGAAREVFDAVVRLLRTQVRGVLAASLVVAALAWWSRPGGWLARAVTWWRGGGSSGRVGAFLAARAGAVRLSLVALVPVWFVVADDPSPRQALGALVAVGVLGAVVEVLVRRAGPSGAAAA